MVLAVAVAGPVLAAVAELARAVVIAVVAVVVLAAIGGAAFVAYRLRHRPPRALPWRVDEGSQAPVRASHLRAVE